MVDLWLDYHRSTSTATRAKNKEPRTLIFRTVYFFMILREKNVVITDNFETIMSVVKDSRSVTCNDSFKI